MSVLIHVLLVPGADGRTFPEDIAYIQDRGIVTHALALPQFQGHPIDASPAYYDQVASLIAIAGHRLRQTTGQAPLFGIGRNLGGSLLAYTAAHSPIFDGLVFTGAIPELSKFRASSAHESARKLRATLGTPQEIARLISLQPLDLVASLEKIQPERCLVQVGTNDPWMDAAAMETFRQLESTYQVQWLPDDHAMVSPATIAARWAFIGSLAHG